MRADQRSIASLDAQLIVSLRYSEGWACCSAAEQGGAVLFATPADVIKHMSVFSGVLPPGVWDIFKAQLQTITSHEQSTLSVAAAG